MNLNDIKTLIVGTIKQAFVNKKTLDKFDDTTGTLKYNGVPVNNTPVFVADDAPIGNIISFMGNAAPQDYLICDGAEYNISDYKLLAQHILNEFGSYNHFGGDGDTTFAVPDLRGEFLRGTGTAARDTGSGDNVGVHQDGTEIPLLVADNSSNAFNVYRDAGLKSNTQSQNYDHVISAAGDLSILTYETMTINSTSLAGIMRTTRPTNTSVLYCIKYQITQNNISKDIVNYSLDEQVVGSWVNGKPLYEKTVKCTTPSSAGSATIIGYLPDNIEFAILNGAIHSSAGSITSLNWHHGTDNFIRTWARDYSYGSEKNSIGMLIGSKVGNDYKSCTAYIVAHYTKTTDAENSFTPDMLSNISTLNTIASDEEVNEVIGGI